MYINIFYLVMITSLSFPLEMRQKMKSAEKMHKYTAIGFILLTPFSLSYFLTNFWSAFTVLLY